MLVALTREVSPSLARCELTHLAREPIDVARAVAQHAAYEAALAGLGCTLVRLRAEPDLPDAVFVEDTAVVLDELAVVTRPGAESRRAETASVARALGSYRTLRRIEPPGTLDGGDVLVAGRRVFVGRSRRSDPAGVAGLRGHLEPLGYAVESVALGDCLHLKSAATLVAPDTLLANPSWTDPGAFRGLAVIEVDPA